MKFTQSSDDSEIGLAALDAHNNFELKVLTPAAEADTQANIWYSYNGQDFVKVNDEIYTYYQSPHIHSVSPEYGPVHQDTTTNITLSGEGFICPSSSCENAKCRFGEKDVAVYEGARIISET